MSDAIVSAIITGVLALAGVIITNSSANRKMTSQIEKNQAVTDTKLEALTREVRVHNKFAERIPALEEQVKAESDRISAMENRLHSVTSYKY